MVSVNSYDLLELLKRQDQVIKELCSELNICKNEFVSLKEYSVSYANENSLLIQSCKKAIQIKEMEDKHTPNMTMSPEPHYNTQCSNCMRLAHTLSQSNMRTNSQLNQLKALNNTNEEYRKKESDMLTKLTDLVKISDHFKQENSEIQRGRLADQNMIEGLKSTIKQEQDNEKINRQNAVEKEKKLLRVDLDDLEEKVTNQERVISTLNIKLMDMAAELKRVLEENSSLQNENQETVARNLHDMSTQLATATRLKAELSEVHSNHSTLLIELQSERELNLKKRDVFELVNRSLRTSLNDLHTKLAKMDKDMCKLSRENRSLHHQLLQYSQQLSQTKIACEKHERDSNKHLEQFTRNMKEFNESRADNLDKVITMQMNLIEKLKFEYSKFTAL